MQQSNKCTCNARCLNQNSFSWSPPETVQTCALHTMTNTKEHLHSRMEKYYQIINGVCDKLQWTGTECKILLPHYLYFHLKRGSIILKH